MAWREAFAFILKNKSLLVNIHVGGEAKSLDEHAFDKHDKASAFEPELNGVTVKTSPHVTTTRRATKRVRSMWSGCGWGRGGRDDIELMICSVLNWPRYEPGYQSDKKTSRHTCTC